MKIDRLLNLLNWNVKVGIH